MPITKQQLKLEKSIDSESYNDWYAYYKSNVVAIMLCISPFTKNVIFNNLFQSIFIDPYERTNLLVSIL
jgi:hypothetical protein